MVMDMCCLQFSILPIVFRQVWSTGTSHMMKETFLSMTSVVP